VSSDKVSEAPPSTREDLQGGRGQGPIDRPGLDPSHDDPFASNQLQRASDELERGTTLDRAGVPLGGGGAPSENARVDTSATDLLNSMSDDGKHPKFGELRLEKPKQ